MKVELCAGTIEALQIAKKLQVDRVELCQSLEQGGLTPSPGFIEYSIALGLETHVLIRPRGGGFRYSDRELEIMVRDVLECKAIGAHGVVIGTLDDRSSINIRGVELLVQKAGGMDVTFHRAFDDLIEFKKPIDQLVDCGIRRILSSGLANNVERGAANLKEMVHYADGRLEIMPGGGVNLNNIVQICNEVNPAAIHFSGTDKVVIDEYSMFSETALMPNEGKIYRMLKALRDN